LHTNRVLATAPTSATKVGHVVGDDQHQLCQGIDASSAAARQFDSRWIAMPLPRSVARFNRRITNRVLGPLARVLPSFGIITHHGRRSGRAYHTPVNVFRQRDGLLVALTYGPESDWVRNVLAAGGCTLQTRGHTLRLGNPRILHDPTHRAVPRILRPLGRLGAKDTCTVAENARLPSLLSEPRGQGQLPRSRQLISFPRYCTLRAVRTHSASVN
jgi:deazaflavin-dependent oxidoreductase (nitroreductase family)